MNVHARSINYRAAWRKPSFALLTTLLLLTLLIATTAELAFVTAVESLGVSRRSNRLSHTLAVDGALLLLAERLTDGPTAHSDLIAALDRAGAAEAAFSVGSVAVRCTIRDDADKLNPILWQRDDQQSTLVRKLQSVQSGLGLPRARFQLRPMLAESADHPGPRYHWFDQLLFAESAEGFFRWDEENSERSAVWSDVLTFWGDGRVALRRASPAVLEAALEDLRPGLGRILLAARGKEPGVDFMPAALTRVDAELRPQVAARVTFDAQRYALRLDTTLGGDRRRWYVVAEVRDHALNVLHRSRVTW